MNNTAIMPDPRIERTYRRLTPEERCRHALIRDAVERDLPRLERRAEGDFLAIDLCGKLWHRLRERWRAEGLTLEELAQRTGIHLDDLRAIDEHPHPQPSLSDVSNVARALGLQPTADLVPIDAAEPEDGAYSPPVATTEAA